MRNKPMNVAGIDVAHKTLVVVIRAEEKNAKAQEFANTSEGHAALGAMDGIEMSWMACLLTVGHR